MLKENGFKTNQVKFFQKKISYCGHKVNQHRIHKIQEKVEAVVNAPRP